MLKFSYKIALFLGMFCIVFMVVQSQLPFYWGNIGLFTKMEYLKNSQEKYNVFFLGSSRTYRQIDPILFDSLLDNRSKSYNLGYAATYVPEVYQFIEKSFKEDFFKPGTILFIELQEVNHLPEKNIHTTEARYHLDYNSYSFTDNYFDEQLKYDSLAEQTRQNYKTAYFENLLFIGNINTAIRHIFMPKQDERLLNYSKAGYFSLSDQLDLPTVEKSIQRRFENFRKDTSVLLERKIATLEAYNNKTPQLYSQVYLERIQRLIDIGKQAKVKIIFVLYPRMQPKSYNNLLPLTKVLSASR